MRRYSREHLWVDGEADGLAAIGITRYGVDKAFGWVGGVHLPGAGQDFGPGDHLMDVRATSAPHNAAMLAQLGRGPVGGQWEHQVKAPLACQLVERNALADAGTINKDPEGEGWIARVQIHNSAEFDALLDDDGYAGFCETMDNLKIGLPRGWIND